MICIKNTNAYYLVNNTYYSKNLLICYLTMQLLLNSENNRFQ